MKGRPPRHLCEPVRLRVVVEYVAVSRASKGEEPRGHHHSAERCGQEESERSEDAEARDFGAVGVRCAGRGALGGGELVVELRRVTLRMTSRMA